MHKKSVVLPFLSTLLLLLTYPPFTSLWAAWIGFVPMLLYIYIKPQPIRDTLTAYAVAGFNLVVILHTVVGAYGWEMFVKMVFAVSSAFAIMMGLFSLACLLLKNKSITLQLFVLTFLPGIFYTLLLTAVAPMGPGPFEGYFNQPLPMLQLAVLGDLRPLAFLILAFNTALMFTILRKPKAVHVLGVIFLIATIIYIWGARRLLMNPLEEGNTRIAIIQTNFPMNMEWRVENSSRIQEHYRAWAREVAAEEVEIIFFPQYNFSGFLDDEQTHNFFSNIAKDTDTFVVAGTYTRERAHGTGKVGQFNIGLTFNPDGELIGSYNAVANLPFREIGELFGDRFQLVETPVGAMGMLLCYEDVVRRVANRWNAEGAEYFVALTNPSTFVNNTLSIFHLNQDRMRAIETGKEVVRVSANGPSAVIDRFGRYRVLSEFYLQDIIYSTVSATVNPST